MNNQNSNIELGSRPSNSRPYAMLNPSSNSPSPNYIPQVDEHEDEVPHGGFMFHQTQPELLAMRLPEDPGICSLLWRDKSVNIPLILIVCIYILDLVLLCCGIASSVTLFSSHNEKIRATLLKPLQFMSENLKADPIMEIQIMDQRSDCPSGFQPLKLAAWPGTIPGCLCESGEPYATSCVKVNSRKCKKDIPRTSSIDMFEWGNSTWCVKRAILGTDYLRKAECPSNYKERYPGGCFLQECPITQVEIPNKPGQNITFIKTQGEFPLIDLQITLGDMPCFTQRLFPQVIISSSYQLSAFKGNGCDKYGQNRQFSKRLASQTAYDSFTQNSFPDSVMNLPYFAEYAENTISVFSSMVRMKTAKHDQCLDINEKSINDYLNTTDGMWGYALLIPIFVIEFAIIKATLDSYDGTSRDKLWRSKEIPDLMEGPFYFNLITVFLLIAMFINFKSFFQALRVLMEDFEKYEALQCFDGSQGSMVVNEFVEVFKRVSASFWYYWVLLVSKIVAVIVTTYLFIVYRTSARFSSASR